MLTLLTAKIEMGEYGISDRQVIGVFDNDEDLEAAVRIANNKWAKHKIVFHSEIIILNGFLIK